MYPKSFYKEATQIKLQKTAVPTGMLNNPLDLVNSSQPWLMIKPEVADQAHEKKTLILADPLFDTLDRNRKKTFSKLITNAKEDGFRILALSSNGELNEINTLNDSYSFPIGQFTKESIYELAYRKYALPASNIHLLDYFAINELCKLGKDVIDLYDVEDDVGALFTLIQTYQLESVGLKYKYSPGATVFSQLFALDSEKLSSLTSKIKSLEFDSAGPHFGEDINKLLNKTPGLETLRLKGDGATVCFKDLPPNSLNNLKELTLSTEDLLTKEVLITLLSAAPNLEKLDLNGIEIEEGIFDDFVNDKLKNIKRLTLNNVRITEQDGHKLLVAMPDLQSLVTSGIVYPNDSRNPRLFYDLPENSFPNLTSFSGTSLDSALIFKLAPRLETVNLRVGSDISKSIDETALQNLKNISLTDINRDDLFKIIEKAHNVETLSLTDSMIRIDPHRKFPTLKNLKILSIANCNTINLDNILNSTPSLSEFNLITSNGNNLFQNIKPNSLNDLKSVNLLDLQAQFTPNQLINLFKAAPNLENISVGYPPDNTFSNLSIESLNKLKSLQINDCEISSKDIASIISNGAELKELTLDSTQETSAFSKFSVNLPKLEKIDLQNSSLTPAELIILLKSSLNLKSINILGCSNIESSIQKLTVEELRKLTIADLTPHEHEVKQSSSSATSDLPQLDTYKHTGEGSADKSYFDTANNNSNFSFVEYFPGIPPNSYRLSSSRPDLDSLQPYSKFPPDDFKPISFATKNYFKDSAYNCVHGMKTATTDEKNEILLPSLDPEEKIFNVEILDEDGNHIPLDKCQLNASDDQFYSITLPKAGKYSINFEVALPDAKAKYPLDLENIYNKYNSFTVAETNHNEDFKNLREVSQYVRENEVGACRLRALAAYDELKEIYQDDVKIIYNDIHAFIEVRDKDKKWYKLDLGGYPAQLNKIEPNAIKESEKVDATVTINKPEKVDTTATIKEQEKVEAKKEEQITSAVDNSITINIAAPTSATKTISSVSVSAILERASTNQLKTFSPMLVKGDADVDFQSFITSLKNKEGDSNNILIANRPEDITLSGIGFTPEGKIKSEYTALNRWLAGREKGTLIVDIREFNDGEIAQLNDLLDRRIENKTLPEEINIILLDKKDRGYYGPDFRRRVPYSSTLANSNTQLLSILPSQPLESPLVIDLYNSPYWQNGLLGSWGLAEKPGENDLSFTWKNNQLLDLLLTPENSIKQIVFKNPPLDDTSFLAFIVQLQSLKRVAWADQVKEIPSDMQFYQATGYDWSQLSKQSSLHNLSVSEGMPPYILSDANILSFVEAAYEFSKESNKLEAQPSYLERSKSLGEIEVVCAPGLSEGSLAKFLDAANKQNIRVRFLAPDSKRIPAMSALSQLRLQPANESASMLSAAVTWELHGDVDYAARKYSFENANTSTFDMSSLDASELSRFPLSSEKIRDHFLKTGKFAMEAPLSDILTKLKNNETVILTGEIPPSLYAPLTSLSLGLIEGERFGGKLIIMAAPKDSLIVEAFTGRSPHKIEAKISDKIELLKKLHPTDIDTISKLSRQPQMNFSELEGKFLNSKFASIHTSALRDDKPSQPDEQRAAKFDEARLSDVTNALGINPWVMIEGSTGIGKSGFLQNVLPSQESIFKIEEWLTRKPAVGQNAILVLDEASFMSELSGHGNNFMERFKGLKDTPPGFLWKGKYFELTEQHKAIFAFNPASYGAGRSTEGFLNEQSLSVTFKRMPDFYLRARIIKPLVDNIIKLDDLSIQRISAPIISVYNWILNKSPNDSLITPREIKAMINIVVSRIKNDKITDVRTITQLAEEVAYEIGRQALSDKSLLAKQFETFKPTQSILYRNPAPEQYLSHQNKEYQIIQNMLAARDTVLSAKNTDLGLGGILLEGGSGIGKTHFINQIKSDYENVSGKNTIRISPSTPFHEKEKLLQQAFQEGALVIAEEFNTSLWPSKLLNNILMGIDEDGNPAKLPGFMLLATQNPPSFGGRSDEDPAMRRRMIKLDLKEWPVFENNLDKKFESVETQIDDVIPPPPLDDAIPPPPLDDVIPPPPLDDAIPSPPRIPPPIPMAYYQKIIIDMTTLRQVLDTLPLDNQKIFLNNIGLDFLKTVIKSTKDLYTLANNLQQPLFEQLYNNVKQTKELPLVPTANDPIYSEKEAIHFIINRLEEMKSKYIAFDGSKNNIKKIDALLDYTANILNELKSPTHRPYPELFDNIMNKLATEFKQEQNAWCKGLLKNKSAYQYVEFLNKSPESHHYKRMLGILLSDTIKSYSKIYPSPNVNVLIVDSIHKNDSFYNFKSSPAHSIENIADNHSRKIFGK